MNIHEIRVGCLSVAKTLDENVTVRGKDNCKYMAACIEFLESMGNSTDNPVIQKEETTDDSRSEDSGRVPDDG